MAYKNKANMATKVSASSSSSSYVDFEPKCELKEEAGSATLIISLPGFKKEQLRVQVSNTGVLKVTGEKPENPEGTIKNRFVKETTVPNGCDVNQIRAKFAQGELRVIMPIKVMTAPPPVADVQQQEAAQMPKPHEPTTSTNHDQMVANNDHQHGKTLEEIKDKIEQKNEQIGGFIETTLARLQGKKSNNNVVIGFGVVVAAIVVVGAYMAFNYGSSTSSPSSYMEE
ncbi:hypothetical protein RND81_08G167300 [Saponaria officinalis]|uniref:SHSP domain-containing protein n=1 Tax=Saponaria officinalis TaxID=3572 RepID=A0AAW1J945_SAPOF